MRTLKFKAQPTNVFFATVNQMFGGSSQLLTAAKSAVITCKSLCRRRERRGGERRGGEERGREERRGEGRAEK